MNLTKTDFKMLLKIPLFNYSLEGSLESFYIIFIFRIKLLQILLKFYQTYKENCGILIISITNSKQLGLGVGKFGLIVSCVINIWRPNNIQQQQCI